MQIALISDIHGNLEALSAVLEDIDEQDVDAIMCLGDIVGYGCDPVECIEVVSERCEVILMGNHDEVAFADFSLEHYNVAAKKAVEWTRDHLNQAAMDFLAGLPYTHVVDNLLLVHSSPWEPKEWHYIMMREDALIAFDCFDEQMCFYGHTHMPMIFALTENDRLRQQAGHAFDPDPDARYLVNIGSVGQPRDDDPRACYVIVDTEEGAVDFRRIDYDLASTQRKMADCGLPDILIDRLAVGR